MISFDGILRKLLPSGRAWQFRSEKIFFVILSALADALDALKETYDKVRDSIFPEHMDEEFIADWEKRFRLPDAGLTVQERRDRLAARWTPKTGQTAEFLQDVLTESGFNVIVLKNEYIAQGSTLGDIIVGDYVLEGNTYAGQKRNYNPCDYAGLPDTYVIINSLDDEGDLSDKCPLDYSKWKYMFFIQGAGALGTLADIPQDRWIEFKELVMTHKPNDTWAIVFANLI